MELKLGVLCDAANISREGKLNILGEFNRIHSPGEPIRWPLCALVARIEAPTVEGPRHELEIDLTDADGRSILQPRPKGSIEMKPMGPGRPLRAQFIANIENLQFPRFGDYEFHVLVDGRSIGTIPVYIVRHGDSASP